jgi:hypothetical protein
MNELILNPELEEIKYEKEVIVEEIAVCHDCLFEMKDGVYLCGNCKLNLCQDHIKKHSFNKHNIFKLKKSTIS